MLRQAPCMRVRRLRCCAVSDECPECPSPNIDQAVAGDGRWEIEWQLMQCDVGASNFYYSFQGSNADYVKMQVVNSRRVHPMPHDCAALMLTASVLHSRPVTAHLTSRQ